MMRAWSLDSGAGANAQSIAFFLAAIVNEDRRT